jgi:transposase
MVPERCVGDCSVGMSGDKSDRYVVLVGRRYFSPEQKRAIVTEATGIGVNVSAVARAHDIKPSLLFRWKREAFEASMQVTAPPPQALVPVTVASPSEPSGTAPMPPLPERRGPEPVMFEIVVGGRTLRVPSDADIKSVRRFVVALEGLS